MGETNVEPTRVVVVLERKMEALLETMITLHSGRCQDGGDKLSVLVDNNHLSLG